MKKYLKIPAIALVAVAALGLGRLLASKVLPMVPSISKLSPKVQEWLFDFIALASGIAGAVVGTKLADKFLGKGGAAVTAKVS